MARTSTIFSTSRGRTIARSRSCSIRWAFRASRKFRRRILPRRWAPIVVDSRSEQYYEIKTTIFNALIDTIDLAQLAQLDAESAREEIRDIVNEIIAIKNVVMSIAE